MQVKQIYTYAIYDYRCAEKSRKHSCSSRARTKGLIRVFGHDTIPELVACFILQSFLVRGKVLDRVVQHLLSRHVVSVVLMTRDNAAVILHHKLLDILAIFGPGVASSLGRKFICATIFARHVSDFLGLESQ